MLFFVFGSLASGKSTLLRQFGAGGTHLVVVESDFLGVARSKSERQRDLQQRLARIRDEQGECDVLYAGQSPLGELLACPVATDFPGIAPCLLDCRDSVRIARLRSRGWQNTIPEPDVLRWAEWMRGHALDPQHDQAVLFDGGARELLWDRWISWRRGDARWKVTVIDNSDDESTATLERMHQWIETQRQLIEIGELPLAAGWNEPSQFGNRGSADTQTRDPCASASAFG